MITFKKYWFIDFVIIAIIISAIFDYFGGYFDISFHRSFNVVDILFPPQHIYLYIGYILPVIAIIIAAIAIFNNKYASQDKKLKKIIGLLALASIAEISAAGFDQIWHLIYGIDHFISLPHIAMMITNLFPLIVTLKIINYHQKTNNKLFLWEQVARLFILSQIIVGVMFYFAEYDTSSNTILSFPISYHLAWLFSTIIILAYAKRWSQLQLAATITAVSFVLFRLLTSLIIINLGFKDYPTIPYYWYWQIAIGIFFDLLPIKWWKRLRLIQTKAHLN